MVRFSTFAVAVALAIAATAGASGSGGTVAFLNNAGLHLSDADGTGLRLIRANGCTPGELPPCPDATALAWSPDGSRLAFVFGKKLYVLDTRDASQRLLPTTFEVSAASRPAWSPDGRSIAFISLDVADDGTAISDLHVAELGSGTVRKLTEDGQVRDSPAWAPGSRIVFTSVIKGVRWELFTVDPAGTNLVQITDSGFGAGANRLPAWSPDGSLLAFARSQLNNRARLHVAAPDGSGLTKLSDAPIDLSFSNPPVWSPDGTKIAFSTPLNGRPVTVSGGILGRDLYVVSRDGSAETRLTQSAERNVADRGPTWSPDGRALAFESHGRDGASALAVYAANADGTCERRIADVGGWLPEWQPASGAAVAQRCADLAVVVKDPDRRAGAAGSFTVTVLNDGTEPLLDVAVGSDAAGTTILSATSRGATCGTAGGKLSCRIARLPAGAQVSVSVRVEARVLSRNKGRLSGPEIAFFGFAPSAGDELDSMNNRVLSEVATPSCSSQTSGAGPIQGTEHADIICGRQGRDRIDGFQGGDRITAGAGRDTILGGAGGDTISARDGFPDSITCGSGVDRVTADRVDRVSSDCERVSRSGTAGTR